MKLAKYFSKIPLEKRKEFISAMSEQLSKSTVSIRSYINGHRSIQAQDVKVIVELTNKNVSKHDLRPDVFSLEDEAA
ncbi:MAG: helix-turn-helix domain-containing protein [Alteromonadaceae bacterium]|nr:helix-turn-helix domain-containing protein [Alteromonadaceae bacterium]